MILGLFILSILVFLIWHHGHWQAEAWPTFALQVPRFQAHRGYHEIEIENTLAAFRAAKTAGAEMIELDVRLSRDGQVVVFHDRDLQRLGNDPRVMSDFTAAELNRKVKAPTLQEVLSDAHSPQKINIELKTNAVFSGQLECAVGEVVRKAGAENRVMISSFNPLAIYRISRELPDVPRALLNTREGGDGNRFYLKRLWLAPYVKAHLLHLDCRDIKAGEIENYQARGIPVALWTVDDPFLARKFEQAGVFSLISNRLLGPEHLVGDGFD